jgi:HAE1 family hydrophobic/amphiphilic exporter-1
LTERNAGTCLINLKVGTIKQSVVKVMAVKAIFQPPAVPGYGAAGGFELRLLDKTGSGDYKKMEAINNDFVKELNKRRELSMCLVSLAPVSQYMMKVDNDCTAISIEMQ